MNKPKSHLALLLIIATAFSLYGTLQPFHHWRIPNEPVLSALLYGGTEHIYLFDILQNLVLFLPFGLFAGAYLSLQKRKAIVQLLLPTLAAFCVSTLIEVIQAYNPDRTSSLLDVVLNTTSGLMGAWLSFPLMRRYENIMQFIHTNVIWPCSNNRWPLLGFLTWSLWAGYLCFPFIPTFMPSQLSDSILPLQLWVKGEAPFQSMLYILNMVQVLMLYFAGQLFLRPQRRVHILIGFITLVSLAQMIIVTCQLTPEMVLGYIS